MTALARRTVVRRVTDTCAGGPEGSIATAMLEHADVIAWVQDEGERFVWANARATELFGRPQAALLGQRASQVLVRARTDAPSSGPGAAVAQMHASYRRVLLEQRPMRVREVMDGADGPRHLEGYVFPVTGPDGVRAVGVVFTDATDRVEAQQRCAEVLALHEDVVANAAVPLAVLDPEGMVLQTNAELRALTELRTDELVGRPFWSVVSPQRAAALQQAFAAMGPSARRLSSEEVLERSGKPDLRCRFTVSRLPARDHHEAGALLTITGVRVEREDIGARLRPVEREVLRQVAAGATTAKIAGITHLSRQGVDYNLRTLMERFGAGNRSELVARAYTLGVLAPGCWPPRLTGDVRAQATEPSARAVAY